ncbi:MAG: DNA gyrase inhibitor YacG [Hyphomicrobium sp.]
MSDKHPPPTVAADADAEVSATATRPCPICKAPITAGSPAATKFRPFCSRACSDIDLLRWLRGGYVVPGTGIDDDEDGETSRCASTADPSEDTTH